MTDLLNSPNYGNGPFPDVPEGIFSEIGRRLVLLQDLELFINFVTKIAFEKDSEKAKESILKADKRTMGQLIVAIRKQVNIKENFNKTLKRVLESRNLFVHSFSSKFNLIDEEGLHEAVKFLLNSMDDLEEVTKIMKAVVIVYARERGFADPDLEKNWREYADLNQLESNHIPKISKIFEKKS